uniref:Uncharacterized protein n=1 Tax=Oryza sativa subsp. japonica TaxID=39947 RepID=Q8LN24_ORYSJ|nr:hypothetical protein [Oryza sativa Japonica Group]
MAARPCQVAAGLGAASTNYRKASRATTVGTGGCTAQAGQGGRRPRAVGHHDGSARGNERRRWQFESAKRWQGAVSDDFYHVSRDTCEVSDDTYQVSDEDGDGGGRGQVRDGGGGGWARQWRRGTGTAAVGDGDGGDGTGAGLAGAAAPSRQIRQGREGRRGKGGVVAADGVEVQRRGWWERLPSARSGGPTEGREAVAPSPPPDPAGGEAAAARAAADLPVSALGSGGGGLRRAGASGHGGGSCDNDDDDFDGGCDEDDKRPPPSTAPPASTPTNLGSARVAFQRPPNSRRWIRPPRGSDLSEVYVTFDGLERVTRYK